MCISGDFEPEKLLEEIKKRLLPREKIGEIKRIYPNPETKINKKVKEQKMDVNIPIFMIGYKDILSKEDIIKKQIATQIILNSLIGKSSSAYQKMYNEGLLLSPLDYDYEFSDEYAHVLISGISEKPEKINEIVVEELKNKEVTKEDFERIKKALYGEYVSEYNDVEEIGRMFLQDAIKGIDRLYRRI